MAGPVRLAVIGAGSIGKRHIELISAEPEAELAAIVDPAPGTRDLAEKAGAAWAPSFQCLTGIARPDGVVIATPNQVHAAHGMQCVEAGIPILVEKPIADTVASGLRLVEAAEAAGVPLLVGHHRRHNAIIRNAKTVIDSGRLGTVLAVNAMLWVYKPDEYFDVPWRRDKGANPVLINLIHDIDTLRFLFGDVASVQARESNAVRGNEVEETVVVLLEFASGVLAAISVSDSIVAPWSWEQTSGENPHYPHAEEPCYLIGGTHGSLSVPLLDVWSNPGRRSWWEPFDRERISCAGENPLAAQIRHFCKVVRGEALPLVSGRDALATLNVVVAVKQAAQSGELVKLKDARAWDRAQGDKR